MASHQEHKDDRDVKSTVGAASMAVILIFFSTRACAVALGSVDRNIHISKSGKHSQPI